MLVYVNGDQRALRSALIHILSNSIKFSRRDGTVSVSIRHADDGHLDLVIADNGIGIAAADIDRVMAPFVQADSSANRQYEGVGVGLPLAQRLIQQHGGELRLESKAGVGTTVTMSLPRERVFLMDGTPMDQASADGLPMTISRYDATAAQMPKLFGSNFATGGQPVSSSIGTC